MGTDSAKNNRGGLGWQNIPDVGIVVPVNRVTDYINKEVYNEMSKKNSNYSIYLPI